MSRELEDKLLQKITECELNEVDPEDRNPEDFLKVVAFYAAKREEEGIPIGGQWNYRPRLREELMNEFNEKIKGTSLTVEDFRKVILWADSARYNFLKRDD